MPFSQPRQGFRNYYERSGSGTPVVLVHGNPGDHMEFSRVVPLLGDDVDVVTPDLHGYGWSGASSSSDSDPPTATTR
ncbi:alpha/beta fold hydrolase [Streptomyces sp. NPDC001226]